MKSHVRLPSPFIVPAVSTVAFSVARKVAWRPAASGTSARVTTPSSFGAHTFEPPAPPPDPVVVVVVVVDSVDEDEGPPAPEPDEAADVSASAHVPSELQIPDAQSEPTWHAEKSPPAAPAVDSAAAATRHERRRGDKETSQCVGRGALDGPEASQGRLAGQRRIVQRNILSRTRVRARCAVRHDEAGR